MHYFISISDGNLICHSNPNEQAKNSFIDGIQAEDIVKLKQNFESKKRVKHHVVECRLSGCEK